jgi:hypothetical protein
MFEAAFRAQNGGNTKVVTEYLVHESPLGLVRFLRVCKLCRFEPRMRENPICFDSWVTVRECVLMARCQRALIVDRDCF